MSFLAALDRNSHIDWGFVHIVDGPASGIINRVKSKPGLMKFFDTMLGSSVRMEIKQSIKKMIIERSISFMVAHRQAQIFFHREFENVDSELNEAAKLVINESQAMFAKAEEVLKQYKEEEVENVVSHKFCSILLVRFPFMSVLL